MHRAGAKRRLRQTGPVDEIVAKAARSGSLPEQIAAGCQLILTALAIWGLFLSDVGARLAQSLQSDVSSARGQLAALNSEKTSVERELISQREEYLNKRFELAHSQQEVDKLGRDARDAIALVTESNSELAAQRSNLGILSRQVAITVPARKQVVCDSLVLRFAGYPRLIHLDPLIAPVRWQEFHRNAEKKDFISWSALGAAWDEFSKEDGKDNTWTKLHVGLADYRIKLDLVMNGSLEKMYQQRRLAPQTTPESFTVSLKDKDRVPGSMSAIKRINPCHSIEDLMRSDELSTLDPGYATWLLSLKTSLEHFRPDLDYGFPVAIPRNESFARLEDEEVRYVRMISAIDGMMVATKQLCPGT